MIRGPAKTGKHHFFIIAACCAVMGTSSLVSPDLRRLASPPPPAKRASPAELAELTVGEVAMDPFQGSVADTPKSAFFLVFGGDCSDCSIESVDAYLGLLGRSAHPVFLVTQAPLKVATSQRFS